MLFTLMLLFSLAAVVLIAVGACGAMRDAWRHLDHQVQDVHAHLMTHRSR